MFGGVKFCLVDGRAIDITKVTLLSIARVAKASYEGCVYAGSLYMAYTPLARCVRCRVYQRLPSPLLLHRHYSLAVHRRAYIRAHARAHTHTLSLHTQISTHRHTNHTHTLSAHTHYTHTHIKAHTHTHLALSPFVPTSLRASSPSTHNTATVLSHFMSVPHIKST